MKKLLGIVILLMLSSCSLTGNKVPTTFEDYYTRNVRATIESTEKTLQSLGLFRSTETSGVFDALVSVPILLSGSLMTDYNIESDGRNASLTITDGKLQYDGLAGTGFLSFDRLGMISEAGNLHVLYDNLQDLGFSTPEMREVFAKFDGTWLSWTREEARASVTDPIELQIMDSMENITRINKSQIEKYLLDYPIWKSTEDMGMIWDLHVYKVELDRANVIELMGVMKQDFTGSGFTTQEQASLSEQLWLMSLTGTIGFHPSDKDILELRLSLMAGADTAVGTFAIIRDAKKYQIILTSIEEALELNYTYTDGETRDDMTLLMSQSGIEMGKMTWYIDTKKGKLSELSLDMMVQWIWVTLKHTQQDDGKFDGRLLLPVGSISWNGTVIDKKLTALKILGASPVGAMDLDLTSSGEMVRGPFVLRVGEEEVMRAMVGIIAESERFRLSVDVPQGTGSTDMIHGEFWFTMKQSQFSGKINAPSWTKPLSELLTELERIAPEQFIEEPQMDIDESQFMIDDMDSLEPVDALQ